MMDYKTIGKALQVEKNRVHVDTAFLDEHEIVAPTNPSRDEGVILFNQIAEDNGLKPLRDPLGYMVRDDNVHNYLQTSYERQYTDAADKLDKGLMRGGSYGMRAVLNKQSSTIRKDMSAYLPKDMAYSECRFIKATPEIKQSVDDFVATRVQMTHSHGIRRSIEKDTFTRLQEELNTKGSNLVNQLLGKESQKQALSTKTLLKNAANNKAGLEAFTQELKSPSVIEKADGDERATAHFVTGDINTAKFLLANKSYLSEFGFSIDKKNRQVTTTWQSAHVDTLYEKREKEHAVNLDLSGIEQTQESL